MYKHKFEQNDWSDCHVEMHCDGDATDFMIARSDHMFTSDRRSSVMGSIVTKTSYIQCAKYLERLAHYFDYNKSYRKYTDPKRHAALFGIDVVAHALKLLNYWLCAVYNYDRSSEMTLNALEKRVRAVLYSGERHAQHPLQRCDAVLLAGTCLMVALKYAVDPDVLVRMPLLTLKRLKGYMSADEHNTRTASLFFACVFLSKTAHRLLFGDACTKVCVKEQHRRTDLLRDGVNAAEKCLLARLDWNVGTLTETDYVALFCDDVDSLCAVRGGTCIRPNIAERKSVSKLRTLANAYAMYALLKGVDTFADGTVPCWTNALCVTLVALNDLLQESHTFFTIRKRLLERRVRLSFDRQFIVERCKELHHTFNARMCLPSPSCRDRQLPPVAAMSTGRDAMCASYIRGDGDYTVSKVARELMAVRGSSTYMADDDDDICQ